MNIAINVDENQLLDHKFNKDNILTRKEVSIALSELSPDKESSIKI